MGKLGFNKSISRNLDSTNRNLLSNNRPSALAAASAIASNGTRKSIYVTDSRGQQNYDQTATAITGRVRWWNVMQAKAGQPFELLNNAGVNGDTVAQMSARLFNSNVGAGFGAIGDAATTVTTAPGINFPGLTDVWVGAGYNDIMGSGATALATFAAAQTGLFDPIRNAGLKLWICTVPHANSAASGYTAARATQLILYNSYLRAYALANPGVELVDFELATTDKASTSIETAATDLRDGTVHENNRGAWKEGSIAAQVVLLRLYPQTIKPVSNAATTALSASLSTITTNPFLIGTSAISTTGYSGSCAGSGLTNSNFVRGGAGTCVLSAVARADGGQNTKMVPTFSAANDTFEYRGLSAHAQAVVGNKYVATCEISFTGPAGAALTAADNLKGVQLYIQYFDGTTNYFSYDWATTTTDVAFNESSGGTLTLRTRPFTIPATGSPAILRPNITITGSGVGSPEIQFGVPKIDLVS